MLCRDMGRSVAEGLSASDFFKMVDDDSAQGCYCEDEELRSLLVEIPAPAADEDVGREAPRESSKEEEGLQGRDEMKQRLFRRLDTNHDGLLLSPELWPFVVRTGFDGSEAEWEEEYAMLCRDMGRSVAEGLSASDFFKMLDDDSSQGCYCEDEELRSLLVEIGAVAADDAAGQEAPGQSSQEEEVQGREAMKQTLFRRLDTNSDGLLLSPELWPFVVKTGFDGSEAEWEEEYAMLCRDMGRSVAEGLSASDFFKMVDDDSEQGCYCEDEELRSLLVEIPAPAADGAASRRPRPAAVSSVAARSPTVTSAPARAPPSKPAEGPQSAEAPDPWGAAVPDPWAAPAAKAAAKGRKGEKGKGKGKDRAAGPAGAAPRQQAPAAPPQDNWAQWRDSGKLGPEHDPSKPALNAAKLLEASRAALAARKAREAQEVEQEAAEIAAAALGAGAPARPPAAGLLEAPRAPAAARPARGAEGAGRPPGEGGEGLREAGAPGQRPGSGAGASGGPPPPAARVPKVASMSEALGQIGYALCQLATGEAGAAGDLVTAVLGSPSTPHALAVASSAMRSMLQGRFGEAETLLALDELVFLPGAGDASVLHGLGELARCIGVHGAPFLNKAMLPALVKVDDKARSVRLAAESATREIMSSNSRFAFEALLPALTAALDLKRSPTMKLHAMRLIAECWRGRDGEAAVSHKLPQLLPAVVALLVDTVSEVRAAAVDTVKVLFRLCRSRDLEPFYSDILACAQGTKDGDVSACVRELAEVVFVQQVEASALAVVLPVLIKALRTRNLRTQRQACIIAKNMCGLVSAVADVTPFTPQLLPQLERISEDASDPDVRAVAGRACASLAEAADLDIVGSVRQDGCARSSTAHSTTLSRGRARGATFWRHALRPFALSFWSTL
ncbi:unnamed protein product [Prorocentrum cordatum]|uniref:EF-hand domain-containing protein n=1 Tax=Prorocentrum cordatum TaxID=2364126 RepID=A0ABN9VCF2_9DINO|nr:unnamed protein product [Polarella glacialis]